MGSARSHVVTARRVHDCPVPTQKESIPAPLSIQALSAALALLGTSTVGRAPAVSQAHVTGRFMVLMWVCRSSRRTDVFPPIVTGCA